ncbi:MAG: thiamine pyrophosphate-dependent dehydrogenase E1 component subunit alpha [Bacteriovoracaceae bacterium]|jgi:TPP-dependent pyruvate/acetoin dehydrogenase alpha subunit|nr:thiamine pyrophosphate-dependent dehydrogenase E1 component subunit alpha [Bacteriovoracaceae bacterium]
MHELDAEKARAIYYDLVRVRRIEEEIKKRYPLQEMRCPVHLSIGQESPAVAISHAINKTDYMMSGHRSHSHYLAKGGDLRKFICELYGRADGCSKGQGGSMHLIDLSVDFLGATSIVGGTVPIAVGAAFSSKLQNENRVTVSCIGDAVVEEGVFHESMNFAAVNDLPVIFFCENNFYSIYTPLPQRQPARPLTDLAKAHGVKAVSIDSSNVFKTYMMLDSLVAEARRDKKPLFLELFTYRYVEHCGPHEDDNLQYRPDSELEEWKAKEPILVAQNHLKEAGIWDQAWSDQIEKRIEEEIHEAFDYAINCPYPPIENLGSYTYAK